MEEDEPVETEASSQKSRLNAIIRKLKELIIQVSQKKKKYFNRRQKEEIWKGLNLSNLKDHSWESEKVFQNLKNLNNQRAFKEFEKVFHNVKNRYSKSFFCC